jgi:predicted nucleotidyltransferase
MINTSEDWNFLYSVYGSKLYGTSTPQSDTDEKVIYVPALDKLLLGKKPKIYKEREDANGNSIPDGQPMPDGGRECEYIPIQTFVHDFVHGQTYAVEIAHAYLAGGPPKHGITYTSEMPVYALIEELVEKFGNADVYAMVGFAMKQTFDYVKRGERLNKALHLRDFLHANFYDKSLETRLDTIVNGEMVLDIVAREIGLSTGISENNNKIMRTLELNGRSYLETTTVFHIYTLIAKLVSSYGDRTKAAAETDVEYKSLSHAIRVYQQVLELLETGRITFPRPNASLLLAVKQGKGDLGTVKVLLEQLDEEVQEKILTSTIRKRTPELEAAAEEWLLLQLHDLYSLSLLDD